MATITPTLTYVSDDRSVARFTWGPMANGDVGSPVSFVEWADRSVQVTGTFGAGGNMRWQGSNDAVNFSVLTDPQGNALDLTAAKIKAVTELTTKAQPSITAGDGTTALTVTLIARRAQPLRA